MNQQPAYKLVILLARDPQRDRHDFAAELLELERTAPIAAAGLLRSVVTTGLAAVDPADESPFDAAIETWWARKNDAADWVVSRAFEYEWLAPRMRLLAALPHAIAGEPGRRWEAEEPYPEGAVQLIALTTAVRSLRKDEFATAYARHADLALAGEESTARIASLEFTTAPLAPPSRFSADRYDGVGTIVFASADALAAEVASEHYRDVVAPDAAAFSHAATSDVMVGTPTVIA